MGDLEPVKETNSPFSFVPSPYGTKTFTNKYDVLYGGERIGTLCNTPRSNIIPEKLNQFQFENHLFYSQSLIDLKALTTDLVSYHNLTFTSVNRLDVAFDINDDENYYRKLQNDLITGVCRLSGRKKSFTSHNEFIKGICINNGFTVGQRSSSKYLRVYNKSLSLEVNEKQYILDYYKANNFSNSNVWRFEYQLNSTFFTNLKNFGHDKDFFDVTNEKLVLPFEDLTWCIFDYATLIKMVIMANEKYFVIKQNTGLKQINAEQTIPNILDFEYLLSNLGSYNPTIVKLKKTHIPNLTKRKRLAKSLFREYVCNQQNVTYIVALNRLLDELNPFDGTRLYDWFEKKLSFYLAEFRQVEKMTYTFDYSLYSEQINLFIE